MLKTNKKLIVILSLGCVLLSLLAGIFLMPVKSQTAFADEEKSLVWRVDGVAQTDAEYEVTYSKTDYYGLVSAKYGEIVYTSERLTVVDAAGETVQAAQNAGKYTFSLNGFESKFTLNILPVEVDLASVEGLRWRFNGENDLLEGVAYTYEYTENNGLNTYCSTAYHHEAPNPNWAGWRLAAASSIMAQSLVPYSGNAVDLSLLIIDFNDYEATYHNSSSAAEGIHSTEVTLTTSVNYRFVCSVEDGATLGGRGMSVTIEESGTAKIIKTWYIVRYENELLSESQTISARQEVKYSVPSWTFGSYQTVEAPYLRYGDEWKRYREDWKNDNYGRYLLTSLKVENSEIVSYNGEVLTWNESASEWKDGTKDVLTFTLEKDGRVIAQNRPRLYWGSYFNEYMPVGSYTLILTVKTITLGKHKTWTDETVYFEYPMEHAGFTYVYRFEVSAPVLSVTDGVNEYGKTEVAKNEVALSALKEGAQFAPTGKITFGSYVGAEAVRTSETYWATVVTTYYDNAPVVLYTVEGVSNGAYRAADADWSDIFKGVGTYRIYYTVSLKNYVGSEGRFNSYYTVTVYDTLATPELKNATLIYNGKEQSVSLKAASELYYLTGNTATNAGEYEAVANLIDPVHYKWESGTGTLAYTVQRAAVRLPEKIEAIYTGTAVKVSLPDLGTLYEVVYPEGTEGFTEAGSYQVGLKLIDSANYYWVDKDGTAVNAQEGKVNCSVSVASGVEEKTSIGTILLIVGVSVEGIAIIVLIVVICAVCKKKQETAVESQKNDEV